MRHKDTYSAMEEVILATRLTNFKDISIDYKREITIYALSDDNHFCISDTIFFSDFMPLILLNFHQGKFSAQEIIHQVIDYATKQLFNALDSMYEACVYALACENMIPFPKDWDKPGELPD